MPPRKLRKSSKPLCRINPLYFTYAVFATLVGCMIYNNTALATLGGKSGVISGSLDQSIFRSSPATLKEPSSSALSSPILNSNAVQVPNQPLSTTNYELPKGFQSMLHRAKDMSGKCDTLPSVPTEQNTVDVPSFGIIHALESYQPDSLQEAQEWQCEVPPSTECDVERFSVIFLGYSVDRLHSMKQQIRSMLASSPYKDLVEEVILVWNNPKPLNESGKAGELLYGWSTRETSVFQELELNRFRVFLPLEHGLSSSLMNRYHPHIRPKSKALLYYDDDGPFYHYRAIKSNFELWKRNSNVQTGAMARAFTLSNRQQREKDAMLGGPNELDDRKFVSHCRDKGDEIGYDYRFFENFHANMVSGDNSKCNEE